MANASDTPAEEYQFRSDHPPTLTPQRPIQSSLPPQRTRRHPTSLPEEFLSDLVELRKRVSQNFTDTFRQQPQLQPHQNAVRSTPQRHSSSFMELPSTPKPPLVQTHYPSHVNDSPSNPVNSSGAMPRRYSSSFTNLPRTRHNPPSPSSHQPRRLSSSTSNQQSQHLQLMPSHQVKNIPTFTGSEKNTSVDDWVRDAKYLLDTTAIPKELQFSTVVRYLGGAARKLILNLPKELQNPTDAFAELKAQFGDLLSGGDPLAEFYERVRRPNESASIYAVELEATLRLTEERMYRQISPPDRNRMLTQQFMRGVKDDKIRQRLAPMKPRDMAFREMQAELRLIEREHRLDSALTNRPSRTQAQPQTSTSPIQSAFPSEQKPLLCEQIARPHSAISQKPEYNPDLMQDVILQMQHLTRQVDNFTRQRRAVQPTVQPNLQNQNNRVFVCYKCGNEGHIARGCRSPPLNDQGQRSQGTPPEPRNH